MLARRRYPAPSGCDPKVHSLENVCTNHNPLSYTHTPLLILPCGRVCALIHFRLETQQPFIQEYSDCCCICGSRPFLWHETLPFFATVLADYAFVAPLAPMALDISFQDGNRACGNFPGYYKSLLIRPPGKLACISPALAHLPHRIRKGALHERPRYMGEPNTEYFPISRQQGASFILSRRILLIQATVHLNTSSSMCYPHSQHIYSLVFSPAKEG